MEHARALIWCAVSSKGQATDDKISLLEQETLAREFCAAQSLAVVDVLIVPGHSRSETDVFTFFEDYASLGFLAYHNLRRHWQANDFDVLVAFHPNRLGRSFSISAFVLENVVKQGRRAYLIQGGWVDDTNVDYIIALAGVSSKSEIKQRVALNHKSLDKRMAVGLPMRRPPFWLRAIRDERGRAIRLEIRDEYRRLIADATELVLNGISWGVLPRHLAERGHRNPQTGQWWEGATLYRMFYSPYAWGFAAQHFGAKSVAWVLNESIAPPPGVKVERHPSTPIPVLWEGTLATVLRAELIRRNDLMAGRAAPNTRYALTGLLRCQHCGRRMGLSGGNVLGRYWACPTQRSTHEVPCVNTRYLRDDLAREQILDFLRRAAAAHLTDLAALSSTAPAPLPDKLPDLLLEITALESQIEAMITQESKAPESARPLYARRIAAAAANLDALKHEAVRLESKREPASRTQEQRLALGEIYTKLDILWSLPPHEANRLLHAALGRLKFIVAAGAIVDIA